MNEKASRGRRKMIEKVNEFCKISVLSLLILDLVLLIRHTFQRHDTRNQPFLQLLAVQHSLCREPLIVPAHDTLILQDFPFFRDALDLQLVVLRILLARGVYLNL